MVAFEDHLGDLAAVVDRLCEADPALLADGDSIIAINRQIERLNAVRSRATAAFYTSREWEADGAQTAAAWLSTRLRLPKGTARREVSRGRQLRDMPRVEEAWLAGQINSAHVDVLRSARTKHTAEAFARDEEMLCGFALELRFHQFLKAVEYWRYQADPDGAEDRAKKLRDERRAHFSQGLWGQRILDVVSDPIDGAIIEKALNTVSDELFQEDWEEAKARLGRDPLGSELARTPSQRLHDAVVEICRRALALPPGSRLPEPLITVLVGFETFAGPICELANGTVVTPGGVVPLLDKAWAERVVFDSPSRVIDVGERRRLFEGATRRAVEVIGRECFHEYCDIPAEDCQIDHIQPWAAGGPTTQANGRPACGFHNRQRHRRGPPSPD
jgi:Domain of unknown function (DUF222)/HNH endonuclease